MPYKAVIVKGKYRTNKQHQANNRSRQGRAIPKCIVEHQSRSKKGGRPAKHVNRAFLRNALRASRNLSLTKLANVLGIHRNTLARRMKEYGLKRSYTDITDGELESEIRLYRDSRPDSGLSYIQSHFRSRRIRVARHRIREAVAKVDNIGLHLRTRAPIIRRKYATAAPNSMWHLDGHHKAIQWGIIVHAIIDGYSRKVSSPYTT
jgi:AraC-like DNA-binding protein